jgi:hypothetical protein
MTTYRDAIAATLSLVLGVAAMAGVVATDLYAQAASAEARGEQALFQTVAPASCDSAGAAHTRLAINEVKA